MAIRSESAKELLKAGQIVADDAAASIRAGSVSGAGHVPSRPGEPPNRDTGRLDTNIDAVLAKSGKSVRVISRAPYSSFLEFGTSRVAERPFMRPALRRNRNRVVMGQVQAVKKVVRVKKGS